MSTRGTGFDRPKTASSAVEYGLIAVLLTVVILGTLVSVDGSVTASLRDMFVTLASPHG